MKGRMAIINCSIKLRNGKIGYSLDLCDDGFLWLEREDGEGMELTPILKEKLLELLDKFYKKHF